MNDVCYAVSFFLFHSTVDHIDLCFATDLLFAFTQVYPGKKFRCVCDSYTRLYAVYKRCVISLLFF